MYDYEIEFLKQEYGALESLGYPGFELIQGKIDSATYYWLSVIRSYPKNYFDKDEVWLIILELIRGYSENPNKAKPEDGQTDEYKANYFKRCLVNKINDYIRKNKPTASTDNDVYDLDVTVLLGDGESDARVEMIDLMDALESIGSDRDRDVFLKRIEDPKLTYSDIGVMYDEKPDTLRKRNDRLREKLRLIYND